MGVNLVKLKRSSRQQGTDMGPLINSKCRLSKQEEAHRVKLKRRRSNHPLLDQLSSNSSSNRLVTVVGSQHKHKHNNSKQEPSNNSKLRSNKLSKTCADINSQLVTI